MDTGEVSKTCIMKHTCHIWEKLAYKSFAKNTGPHFLWGRILLILLLGTAGKAGLRHLSLPQHLPRVAAAANGLSSGWLGPDTPQGQAKGPSTSSSQSLHHIFLLDSVEETHACPVEIHCRQAIYNLSFSDL